MRDQEFLLPTARITLRTTFSFTLVNPVFLVILWSFTFSRPAVKVKNEIDCETSLITCIVLLLHIEDYFFIEIPPISVYFYSIINLCNLLLGLL